MRLVLLIALLHIAPACAIAGLAPDLSGVAYEQKPGALLPLNAAFSDDKGDAVRLSDIFQGRPLILVLGYFRCPKLCGIVRADLFEALARSRLVAGKDYSLAIVSIDPSETSVDAAASKASDLVQHPAPGAAQFWRFLTGGVGAAQSVAAAVGFNARFAKERDSFPHPVGVVFVTSTGVVSSYLLGVGYGPEAVRRAVERAASGDILPFASAVMLLCFDYDPATGRYTPAIMKLLRVAAVLTVVIIAGGLFLATRNEGAGA